MRWRKMWSFKHVGLVISVTAIDTIQNSWSNLNLSLNRDFTLSSRRELSEHKEKSYSV